MLYVKELFPALKLALSTELKVYRYDDNRELFLLQEPTFQNDWAELYRYKENNGISVIVIRKAFDKYSRELIYHNCGGSPEYGRILGNFAALIMPRSGNDIYCNRIDIIPLAEPEKKFTFSLGSRWTQCSRILWEGGVLTLDGGHNFRFECEGGIYREIELSRDEARELRIHASKQEEAGNWVPGRFIE